MSSVPPRPPRPPTAASSRATTAEEPEQLSFRQRRRRRRSSARFWRPSQRELDGDDNAEGGTEEADEDDEPMDDSANATAQAHHALKLNAENRITARNSWNLQLIDNIDSFLEMDNAVTTESNETAAPATAEQPATTMASSSTIGASSTASSSGSSVNFTKASCTLDASVKIYSVRVDDVHLTSYKVLANWHRSSRGKASGEKDDGNEKTTNPRSTRSAPTPARASRKSNNHDDGEDRPNGSGRRTLESNLANITVHSLDAAFDIDPLFSKVSTKSGSGSGLLLDTLCVAASGCNLVLDSSCDDKAKLEHKETSIMDRIDLATLRLPELDDLEPDQVVPLVPQLSSLRADLARLAEQGFYDSNLDDSSPTMTSRKHAYGADAVEENEADQSIHKEALERSLHKSARKGMATPSKLASMTPMNLENPNDNSLLLLDDDDFGGTAWDDGDDNDDGFGFAFDNDPPSTPEFGPDDSTGVGTAADSSTLGAGRRSSASRHSNTTTGVLMDAIASGTVSVANESESQALHDWFQSQPGWAGATHWKRAAATNATKKDATANSQSTTSQRSTKKARQSRKADDKDKSAMVEFSIDPSVHLTEKVMGTGKRRKNAANTDSFQWTKVTKTKNSKANHLLPVMDMGMDLSRLSTLFLRPQTALKSASSGVAESPVSGNNDKHVDFGVVETWDVGGDDDSWGGGDDDGGAGYAFGDDDDEDLSHPAYTGDEDDGIRRVEKIHVKYATVAKKVDVKRLKRDLWMELEQRFAGERAGEQIVVDTENDASVLNESKDDASVTTTPVKDSVPTENSTYTFQQAVQGMETSRSQVDVTLPFYFICILHLANEKGLRLESTGLEDFEIHNQDAVDGEA